MYYDIVCTIYHVLCALYDTLYYILWTIHNILYALHTIHYSEHTIHMNTCTSFHLDPNTRQLWTRCHRRVSLWSTSGRSAEIFWVDLGSTQLRTKTPRHSLVMWGANRLHNSGCWLPVHGPRQCVVDKQGSIWATVWSWVLEVSVHFSKSRVASCHCSKCSKALPLF